MLNKLTYQQKNKYLIVGTILFLLLAYPLTVQKTIKLHAYNKQLKAQMILATDAPNKIRQYESQIQNFEQQFHSFDKEGMDYQAVLLEVVSNFCQAHDLVLRNFPSPDHVIQNDLEIITNTLDIEGSYHNLLQLIYELEQVKRISRVASVDFHLEKDFRKKRRFLVATIYLQHIKNNITDVQMEQRP